jgi:hypothetical protein
MKQFGWNSLIGLAFLWGVGCGESSREEVSFPSPPQPAERFARQTPQSDPGAVLITEFMAANDSTLKDAKGNYSDWIELSNAGDAAFNLEGWHLTDDPDQPQQWTFPPRELAPQEHLVVYASGENVTEGPAFHTSFRLSADGDYLALADPSGRVIQAFAPTYPKQRADLSYGIGGQWTRGGVPGDYEGFLASPTPGAPNDEVLVGRVEPITANLRSGSFEREIKLELSTKTVAAEIYYSLDGSEPSSRKGRRYREPVIIDRDSVLKARGYKPLFQPSSEFIGTYLRVDGDRAEGSRLLEGDLTLPLLSISVDPEDLEGANGLLGEHEMTGRDAERSVTLEWLGVDSEDRWSVRCGMRLRSDPSAKGGSAPAWRLYFRDFYGPAKLEQTLFDPAGADEFDRLDLVPPDEDDLAGLLWNAFFHELAGSVGQPFRRGRFCHVLLNGGYSGLYRLSELVDLDFADHYFDGKRSEFDLIAPIRGDQELAGDGEWYEAKEGQVDRFRELIESGKSQSLALEEIGPLIDVENFTRFRLLSWLVAHENSNSWPDWLAIRNQTSDKGFRFVITQTFTLGDASEDGHADGLDSIWESLLKASDVRARVEATVKELLGADGELSSKRLNARLDLLMDNAARGLEAHRDRWGADGSQATVPEIRQQLTEELERRHAALLRSVGALGLSVAP